MTPSTYGIGPLASGFWLLACRASSFCNACCLLPTANWSFALHPTNLPAANYPLPTCLFALCPLPFALLRVPNKVKMWPETLESSFVEQFLMIGVRY